MGTEIVKKSKKVANSAAKVAESTARDIMASMPGAVPSPSRVSNQIDLATSRLVRRARSASTSLQLHQVTQRVPVVRQAISNVVSVDTIVSLGELTLLLNKIIPRAYPVSHKLSFANESYISLSFQPNQSCTHSTVNLSSSQISSNSFRSRISGAPSSHGVSLPSPSHSHLPMQ